MRSPGISECSVNETLPRATINSGGRRNPAAFFLRIQGDCGGFVAGQRISIEKNYIEFDLNFLGKIDGCLESCVYRDVIPDHEG